jgi:hypothetical protein
MANDGHGDGDPPRSDPVLPYEVNDAGYRAALRGTAFACLTSTSTYCGDLSSPAHVSFATRLTTTDRASQQASGASKVCLSPTTLEDCRVAFLLTGNPRACSHPGHPGDLCGLEGSYLLRLRLHGALPEQRVLARPFYFIFYSCLFLLCLCFWACAFLRSLLTPQVRYRSPRGRGEGGAGHQPGRESPLPPAVV